MGRHVIVISEDAMVFEDVETLKKLPTFSKIWDQCARVNKVRSIYPTLTYPAHATMMTGVRPGRHGIVNNEVAKMGEKSSDWEWFADALKVPTIFDAAHDAGLTTAGVFWPVTGSLKSVDYLIAEYWPQSADETMRQCFINAGTSEETAKIALDPNLHLQVNRTHPYCDNFINACACSIIREYKPHLLMIHPANVDAYRHGTGLFSDKVTHGLHEIDMWLDEIIRATKDAGIYEETDFFVVSDHGQLNITRGIALNCLLKEMGLIRVDENGNVTDWDVFIKSAALSAQVYLKDAQDEELKQKVKKILDHWCEEGIYGISRVYTAEEAWEEEGLKGGFSFVIETDGFTTFNNDWDRPLVRPLDISDYRYGKATHGHHPDKGPQPTLIAFGPDIQPGVVIDRADLTDEAPTFAKALGIEMKDTDGKAIEEIFR